jgi:3-hydroxyacyl-CoA dehydrogenase
MKASPIQRVAVIGGGLMGSGIAEVCARADLDVIVIESNDEAAETARARLEQSLRRAAERGKIADPAVVGERITFSSALEDVADRHLGKQAIDCQDRAGFVVNALLVPFVLSAIRMYESGFASAEDIDRGLVLGAAHPQGPLALADLIGLDTTKAVAESLYEEFKEPLYAARPLLARMVDAGLLGRKTGRGFYDYDSSEGRR